MDVKRYDKKLVCIEYPGIVKNVNNMLKTLGGESSISQTYNDSSSRMAVRFRPDDLYSKCCHGDRFNTTNMLMRVVRRRRKGQTASEWVVSRVEILGIIDTTYKFRGMVDYQYLPITKNLEGKYESLIPQLIPRGLELYEWCEQDAPVFIQPSLFSRIDQPSNYHFRREPVHRNANIAEAKVQHPPNLIGQNRKKRTANTHLVSIEDKEVPEKPSKAALDQIEAKRINIELVEKLKQVFEERPIWSKSALVGHTGFDKERLKFTLPVVAYYFVNGPWRTTWTRFNFDPRKEPLTKIYQVLDFRIHRRVVSDNFMKKVFRKPVHSYKLNPKGALAQSRVGLINTTSLTQGTEQSSSQEGSSKDDIEMYRYVFRCGHLPLLRQTFYQFCDIEVDEVQQLVHANDGQEGDFLEKDGWCISGTLDRCREILYREVNKTMAVLKNQNASGSENIHYEENDSDDEITPSSDDDVEDENMEID